MDFLKNILWSGECSVPDYSIYIFDRFSANLGESVRAIEN